MRYPSWKKAFIIGFAVAGLCVGMAAMAADEQFAPTLAVKIPTVHFKADPAGSAFLGQYIGGIYEYGAGLASFLAGIMLLIGGLQYVAGKPEDGKKRIENGVAGLILVLFAYTILNTINFKLVSYSPLVIKRVQGESFNSAFGGADPDKVGAEPTKEDKLLLDQENKNPGTNPADPPVKTAPAMGSPPIPPVIQAPTSPYQPPQMMTPGVPDLYAPPGSPKNPLGVQVKCADPNNCKPRERMYSICPYFQSHKGKTEQELIANALAVLRVWISEAISGGPGGSPGAIYIRNNAGTYAVPDWGWAVDWFKRNSCGQAALAPYGITPETIGALGQGSTVNHLCGKTVPDPDNCVPNKWWPQGPPICQTKYVEVDCTVLQELQQAYTQCVALPAYQAGLAGNDCSNFMYAILNCAGFPTNHTDRASAAVAFPGARTGEINHVCANGNCWDIPKDKINYKVWADALDKIGGPKIMDMYHTRCHTFMYVGGQGLQWTNGKMIYWIEMGGPGSSETGGSTYTDFKIHYDPSIETMSNLGCYYYDYYVEKTKFMKQAGWKDPITAQQQTTWKNVARPNYVYVLRMLDQAQGKVGPTVFAEPE